MMKPKSAASSAAVLSKGPAAKKQERWWVTLFGAGLFRRVNTKLLLALTLLLWASAYAVEWYRDQALVGQTVAVDVQSVEDGDWFTATVPSLTYAYLLPLTARFRLRGIDAPELDQPYGVEAVHALRQLIAPAQGLPKDVQIVCRIVGKDQWSRYVSDVYVRTGLYSTVVNVQREMVGSGYAWAFPTSPRAAVAQQQPSSTGASGGCGGGAGDPESLQSLMSQAQERKQGLWRTAQQLQPEAPWIHRQKKRRASAPVRRGGSFGPNGNSATEEEHQYTKEDIQHILKQRRAQKQRKPPPSPSR